jgi:ABC-type phosphate transport system substrate-binding protein
MRLKPLSLRKPRVRVMLAVGMAVVGFSSLALAQTSPARADPTETLVAVGSDTIQDVYNQFALDASGNLLGSYNAVNPVTATAHEIITPVDGTAGVNCSFARPNGSTEGVGALRVSLNPASTLGLSEAPTPVPGQGCVDIARSSSGPGGNASTTGPIVYVPFALDAVAGSTGPAAGTCEANPSPCASYQYSYTGANNVQNTVTATPVDTAITNADKFTFNDLVNLYKNCTPITEGGVTYDPTGTVSGDTKIDLYVPQPGSGTLSFWANTLGFSATSLPSCVHQSIIGGALASVSPAVPVEEHNGTPMATDPNGFGPFSIAQWISQRNGHDDRRHTAVVHSLAPCSNSTTCSSAVSPFSNGNPATGSLNTNFPITRDVYSIVSFARVTTPSDPLYGLLNNANPAGAFICQDSIQIISYGFALLPSTTCGEVIASNRALG